MHIATPAKSWEGCIIGFIPPSRNKKPARAISRFIPIPLIFLQNIHHIFAISALKEYSHTPAKSWVGCIIGFDPSRKSTIHVPIYLIQL